MVDERGVESVGVVSHHFQGGLDLLFHLIVIGDVVKAYLALLDERELQRCVEVVDQLLSARVSGWTFDDMPSA